MERTLWGVGLAADMTQGCHPMHRALNRRNPGITEEADPVAEWQLQLNSVHDIEKSALFFLNGR